MPELQERPEDPRARALVVVDAVFARMIARYGDEWVRKWAGVEASDLKADWARTIGHFGREALAYGLRYLPERPPNAAQFAAICVRAPEPKPARLAAPKADPERVADAMVAAKRVMSGVDGDPLAGARSLRQRELRGERLTMTQRSFWRTALARELAAQAEASQ